MADIVNPQEYPPSSGSAEARIPSLDESLQKLPTDFENKMCSENHLLKLTDYFTDNLATLATNIGLTYVEWRDIEIAWPHDPKRQRIEMFQKWKEKKKQQATYRCLVEAFSRAGMNSVVDDLVHIMLTEKLSVSQQLQQDDAQQSLPTPPECITKYGEYLKFKYKAMSTMSSPKWPPSDSLKHPVQLAIIDCGLSTESTDATSPITTTHKGVQQAVPKKYDFDELGMDLELDDNYDYLHRNIDCIVCFKEAITLSEIFKPLEYQSKTSSLPLKVLMDGAPGVGKTTLARQACKKWGSGEMLQKQFHLVVLVPLREARNRKAKTIDMLFPGDDPELKEQVLKHVKKTSGENILLIFDGFDELSSEDRHVDSLFLDVIKGDCLVKCNVLVTSRPYASDCLLRFDGINRHVEVLGFTEEQIRSCIQHNIHNKSKAEDLILKLRERLDIASLCYIPLNCAIVLHVYQQNDHILPNTLTELFTKFLLSSLKRHAHIVLRSRSERMLRKLNSLQESKIPEPLKKRFRALSKLAYDGLNDDKLIFSYDNLEDAFSDEKIQVPDNSALESYCLDLVTTALAFTSNDEIHYQFLHLSIQEFLAAWYVANSFSKEEKLSFFMEHLHEERFRLVLLFLAGLTQLNISTPERIFEAYQYSEDSDDSKQTTSDHIQGAEDNNHSEPTNDEYVQGSQDSNDLELVNSDDVEDRQSFDTNDSDHHLSGQFSHNYSFCTFDHDLSLIFHLVFESQKCAELYPKVLEKLPGKADFKIGCTLTSFDCMVIAHFFCSTTHHWKQLYASHSLLDDRSVDIFNSVCSSYQKSSTDMTTFETVHLGYNLPSLANSVFCIPWLSCAQEILCTSLKDWNSKKQHLSCDLMKLHTSTQTPTPPLGIMPQTLKALEIEQCSFLVVKSIAPRLRYSNTLKRLHIQKVNTTAVTEICKALEYNSSVEELLISWYKSEMEDDSLLLGDSISKMLEENSTLKTLKLDDDSDYTVVNRRDIEENAYAISQFLPDPEPIRKLENVLNDKKLADILISINSTSCQLMNLSLCETKLERKTPQGMWDLTPEYYEPSHKRFHRQRTTYGTNDCRHCYIPQLVVLPQLYCAITLAQSQCKMCVRMMKLKTLDLRVSDISSSRAINIFQLLEDNISLEWLDLSENSKIPEGDSTGVANAIGKMLERNTVLKKLSLREGSADDNIVSSISDTLKRNQSLMHLSLDRNSLSDSSVERVLLSITSNECDLLSLDICGISVVRQHPNCIVWSVTSLCEFEPNFVQILNYPSEKERMTQLFCVLNRIPTIIVNINVYKETLLFNKHIAGWLDLSQAGITNIAAINILQSVQLNVINLYRLDLSKNKLLAQSNCKALSQTFEELLMSCKTLKVLDLHGETLNDTTAKGIANGLAKSTSLEEINVSDNPLSDIAIADILSAAHFNLNCSQLLICKECFKITRNQHRNAWILGNLDGHKNLPHIQPIYNITSTSDSQMMIKENRAIVNVLHIINLSSMPFMQKVFRLEKFSFSKRPPIKNLHLLKQIFNLFKVSDDKIVMSNSVTSVLEIKKKRGSLSEFLHSSECPIDVILSCTCTPVSQLSDHEMKYRATFYFKVSNSYFCDTHLLFENEFGSLSIQEEVKHLKLFERMEQQILSVVLYYQLNIAHQQKVSDPLQRYIVNNIFEESRTDACCIPNTIQLEYYEVSDTDIQAIVSSLEEKETIHLTKLVLKNTTITVDGTNRIFQSLRSNSCLKQLTIVENFPEDKSEPIGLAIQQMLQQNSTLKELTLLVNNVTAKGISIGLEFNNTLEKLELQFDNELSSDDIIAKILDSTNSSNLRQLVLPYYKVDFMHTDAQKVNKHSTKSGVSVQSEFYSSISQNIMNVRDPLRHSCDITDLIKGSKVMLLNPCLNELRLATVVNERELQTDSFLKALENMLETSKTIQILHLKCHGPSNALSKCIAAGIRKNKSVKSLEVLLYDECNFITLIETLQSLQYNSSITHLKVCTLVNSETLGYSFNNMFVANTTITSFHLQACLHCNGILPQQLLNNKTLRRLIILNQCDCHLSDVHSIFNLLQLNSNLEELAISWYEVAESDCKLVGQAIEKMLIRNTTLKILDIRQAYLTDYTAKCIASGLQKNCSLKMLALNYSLLIDNSHKKHKVSDDTIAAIHSSANSSNLVTLEYSNYRHVIKLLRRQASDCVWELIFKLEKQTVTVYDFGKPIAILSENEAISYRLPFKLVISLGRSTMSISTKRYDVDFHWSTSKQTVVKILEILQHQISVKELALFGTFHSCDYYELMALGTAVESILTNCTTLKLLDFTKCCLVRHDLFVSHVANGLKGSKSLNKLYLTNSGITVNGVVSILQALKNNIYLEVLDLSNNPHLMQTGDSVCDSENLCSAFLRENSTLKELYIANLHDSHVIAQVFCGLFENKSLLKLDVTGTLPESDFFNALVKMLEHNTTLTELSMTLACDWYQHINHIPIVQALLSTTSLKTLKIQAVVDDDVKLALFIYKTVTNTNSGKLNESTEFLSLKIFFDKEMEGLRRLNAPDQPPSQVMIMEYPGN